MVEGIGSGGMLVEILAMIDSGSNTSLLSKNTAEQLEITGTATHLTTVYESNKWREEVWNCSLLSRVQRYQKDPGRIHYKETNSIHERMSIDTLD